MEKERGTRRMDVALFRYALVSQVLDPDLTAKQRGRLARELAAQEHRGPGGQWVTVSRDTIDRWAKAYKQGGFDALLPKPRNVAARTCQDMLDLAFALKKERPNRTAAQVAEIIKARYGDGPARRTLQTHFARQGLTRVTEPQADTFGRYEAETINERWIGDALHGPKVGGRKTILFAWIDDYSRMLVGYRWVRHEDTFRAETVLRPALETWGIPKVLYMDNGAPFVDRQLKTALARLGVKLTHSKPGRPQGRGKIERFFRTVRDQFLVEIDDDQLADLDEMNRKFTAWVQTSYHQRVHGEAESTPKQRWDNAKPNSDRPVTAQTLTLMREAFLWTDERTVTKTATISLHANTYEVDAHLAGRRVEVRYDPTDLTSLDVYLAGQPAGKAVPHVIKAHTHKKAKPDEATPPPIVTGISFLDLLTERHEKTLADPISFADLADIVDNNGKQVG